MAVSPSYQAFILEQLSPLLPTSDMEEWAAGDGKGLREALRSSGRWRRHDEKNNRAVPITIKLVGTW
jgi:hypothetical protein